jgi:small subunit ribosomal protein S9
MSDETPEETPDETPVEETPVEPVAEEKPAEEPKADAEPAAPAATDAEPTGEVDPKVTAASADSTEDQAAKDQEPAAKPAIPGMDLEVDLVGEGADPLSAADAENVDPYALSDEPALISPEEEKVDEGPIAAEIKLAADARYRATGKRKTAVARVTLKPGTGEYLINGRTLNEFFPRDTLQRNIRQPLETVGYEAKMDVVARIHGGGVSSQGGALRHGISRALLEADPNLRGELKRRGFLTRDARVKERKKAGLKKARKKPQFSKR